MDLVNVTFTHAITHKKHHVQSGCSMQSALDIFNVLYLLKSQSENKKLTLECMNNVSFIHKKKVLWKIFRGLFVQLAV